MYSKCLHTHEWLAHWNTLDVCVPDAYSAAVRPRVQGRHRERVSRVVAPGSGLEAGRTRAPPPMGDAPQ